MAALDLGNFQRFRGTKSFILKALCRQALGVIDIPTAPSPNFRENAHNRRGLLTNARDIDGQQRKESAWFLNQRDSVCPRAAKCEGLRETSADRRVVDFL